MLVFEATCKRVISSEGGRDLHGAKAARLKARIKITRGELNKLHGSTWTGPVFRCVKNLSLEHIMPLQWPQSIWIVRHGESAGNVARDLADKAGHSRIDIAERDVDVPLSDLGVQQSEALGQWFAAQPESAPTKRDYRIALQKSGADGQACRSENSPRHRGRG